MNALEKITDLLIAFALLFFVPLLYYSSGKRIAQAMLAGQAGENFLMRVSTAGEITMSVWSELETALERYGEVTFLLQRERILYEPAEEKGEVSVRTDRADKNEIEEQILNMGRCRLLRGDRLWLTLYVGEIPTVYYTTVRTGSESS